MVVRFKTGPVHGESCKETDLYVLPFQFDVKATCRSGYVGTAAVTPCNEPNEAYVTLLHLLL